MSEKKDLESRVLGEELVVEQVLDAGPVLLAQPGAPVDDLADLGVLHFVEALRPHALFIVKKKNSQKKNLGTGTR